MLEFWCEVFVGGLVVLGWSVVVASLGPALGMVTAREPGGRAV